MIVEATRKHKMDFPEGGSFVVGPGPREVPPAFEAQVRAGLRFTSQIREMKQEDYAKWKVEKEKKEAKAKADEAAKAKAEEAAKPKAGPKADEVKHG